MVKVATMLDILLPAGIEAEVGATTILTDGTVIFTAADFVLSAKDVAVTVTVRSPAGGVEGAL